MKCEETVPKLQPTRGLRRGNYGRRLIGVGALFVTGIDRSGYVVIGGSVGDSGVGIKRACVQNRIDFRVRPTRLHAAINVVADNVLRRARRPGKIYGVL